MVPDAVASAFLLGIMGLLFVEGMRTVFSDGLNPRKTLIVGFSLVIGVGLQGQEVLTYAIGGAWGTLLGNGMTVGTITAILLTLFIEVSNPRRKRLDVELHISALPRIHAFLDKVASSNGWDESSTNRLRFVGEETLASLLVEEQSQTPRRLVVIAHPGVDTVELEFLAVLTEENLEDRIAYLSERAKSAEQREVSLRLLHHFAAAVHHRKYHGADVIKIEVEKSHPGS